jgi:hypothetical protein
VLTPPADTNLASTDHEYRDIVLAHLDEYKQVAAARRSEWRSICKKSLSEKGFSINVVARRGTRKLYAHLVSRPADLEQFASALIQNVAQMFSCRIECFAPVRLSACLKIQSPLSSQLTGCIAHP